MSKFRLSCDDGCSSDLRVAKLAEKYNIECIFYWPVEWNNLALENDYEPLSYVDALAIAEKHEIGSHGVTHRRLTRISEDEAIREIVESKLMLQKLFGKQIQRFCPSRGYTNETLTRATLNLYDSQRLTRGKGLVHVHPNSGVNDNKPWRECVNEDTEELFCHSWELDKYSLWEELEQCLKSIS